MNNIQHYFTIQREKYNALYKNRTTLFDFILCDYYSGKLPHLCFEKVFKVFGEHSVRCNESKEILDLMFSYYNNETNNQHSVQINFTEKDLNLFYDNHIILNAEYYEFINENETLVQTFENMYYKISFYILCVLSISCKDEFFYQKIEFLKEKLAVLENDLISKKSILDFIDYFEPYYPYIGYFEAKNTLFRIRECKKEQISYPTQGLNKVCLTKVDKSNPIGRFNYENEMVLYSTFGNEVACFLETMPKDEFILTNFNLKNRVLIADFTKIYEFNEEEGVVSTSNIFLNIIKRKVIKKIIQEGYNSIHILTNAIKDYVLDKTSEIKGFLYNSIHDFASFNLALFYNPQKDDNIIFNYIKCQKGLISNDFVVTRTYNVFDKESLKWKQNLENPTIHSSTAYYLSQKTITKIINDINGKL